jgi:hypothetical protein
LLKKLQFELQDVQQVAIVFWHRLTLIHGLDPR